MSPLPLTPENVRDSFALWYAMWADQLGLDADPDHPEHHYDFRAAWMANAGPDAFGHWPSEFKRPEHPNRYVESERGNRLLDTKTGRMFLEMRD